MCDTAHWRMALSLLLVIIVIIAVYIDDSFIILAGVSLD